jgi:hypothetical protein
VWGYLSGAPFGVLAQWAGSKTYMLRMFAWLKGAAILSITTLSISTFSITTLGITSPSIMTLSIKG